MASRSASVRPVCSPFTRTRMIGPRCRGHRILEERRRAVARARLAVVARSNLRDRRSARRRRSSSPCRVSWRCRRERTGASASTSIVPSVTMMAGPPTVAEAGRRCAWSRRARSGSAAPFRSLLDLERCSPSPSDNERHRIRRTRRRRSRWRVFADDRTPARTSRVKVIALIFGLACKKGALRQGHWPRRPRASRHPRSGFGAPPRCCVAART